MMTIRTISIPAVLMICATLAGLANAASLTETTRTELNSLNETRQKELAELEKGFKDLEGSYRAALMAKLNVEKSPANKQARILRITRKSPTVLQIQAIGGTWATDASYTANYLPKKECFMTWHAEAKGGEQRLESYKLTATGMEVRHWSPEQTMEKPETTGVGTKMPKQE